ncbi:hypothetical protein BGZ50_005519 [Haplosporangium sp. Z 11]|nr:hypothetical protein BGZ50_005519 [Haplosporangium sp. Z 11]
MSKRKQQREDPIVTPSEGKAGSKKRKGDTQFIDQGRKSLQLRHSTLGLKWTLESGTVVEDVLFEAGKSLSALQ